MCLDKQNSLICFFFLFFPISHGSAGSACRIMPNPGHTGIRPSSVSIPIPVRSGQRIPDTDGGIKSCPCHSLPSSSLPLAPPSSNFVMHSPSCSPQILQLLSRKVDRDVIGELYSVSTHRGTSLTSPTNKQTTS